MRRNVRDGSKHVARKAKRFHDTYISMGKGSFENPCGTMLVAKGILMVKLEFHLQDNFVSFVALLKPHGCELSCLNGWPRHVSIFRITMKLDRNKKKWKLG